MLAAKNEFRNAFEGFGNIGPGAPSAISIPRFLDDEAGDFFSFEKNRFVIAAHSGTVKPMPVDPAWGGRRVGTSLLGHQFMDKSGVVSVSDELRNMADEPSQFQEAVRNLLALPVERTEVTAKETVEPHADRSRQVGTVRQRSRASGQSESEAPDTANWRMLSDGLKAVFPVEDAGSFASLLNKLDRIQPSKQTRNPDCLHTIECISRSSLGRISR